MIPLIDWQFQVTPPAARCTTSIKPAIVSSIETALDFALPKSANAGYFPLASRRETKVDLYESKHREVKYHWKMLDGTPCSMTLFDVTTSEADEAAKACGWPGSSGSRNADLGEDLPGRPNH